MCIVCMQRALPEWERFEAEQRALAERTTNSSRPDEWTRMNDSSGSTDAPALLTAEQSEPALDPQYAGTAQGGTANGISEGFNQQLVDYLVYRGGDGPFYWQTGSGAIAQTVTYGFTTSASFATGYSEATGWSAFTTAQKDAARLAISLWDDLVATSFVESANGNTADIKFSNTTQSGFAHAYTPGTVSAEGSLIQRMQGSFWVNPQYDATQQSNDLVTPNVGDVGFETYLHELGHALGLGHAGNYNGGNPQYGSSSTGWMYAEDTNQYTVMSYFHAENTGANWGNDTTWAGFIWDNYAQTPMVYDIKAIQMLYGADYTTRAGNTTYGFNANTGGNIFDFSINAAPILTIWDGAGTDTIDLTGWSSNSILSLVAGSYSSVNGMTQNLAIAYDVDMENAVTGAGHDTVTGNDLANFIAGNAGNDELFGYGGNDGLYGGSGNDELRGGAGLDWLYGGTGIDWLYGDDDTDALFGEDNDDIAYGGSGGDSIDGGFGNDELHGDAGVDWLYGSFGDDFLFGGADGDALFGQEGQDTLNGDDGDDSLDGGAGNDILNGGAGVDWLFGGNDNDTLNGGADTDALFGEQGLDALYGGDGGDSLDGGSEDDSLFGEAGDDWLFGGTDNDLLDGGTGSDVLFGDGGNDRLQGGLNGDSLDGGDGDDLLDGGAGIDVLYGGAGADTFFVLSAGEGGDVIRDFVSGEDRLLLDPTGFGLDGSFSGQIAETMFSSGNGLALSLGSGPQFYLETAGQGLWFDATGGDTSDIVIVAGFETSLPQWSDIWFDNAWV
jgi:Ca2+-binding RTX toxin-like protein